MHARIGWQNLRASEFLESGEFLLITGTDFVDGTVNYNCCHYVDKSRYDQDPNIQVKNGNILLTKDGTLGKVAFVQGLSKPATLNAGVFNIVVKDLAVIDSRYLFHYLRGSFLMDYVDKNATGGTIKHLNQNILVDFPVLLPPIHEQRMLGITLSKIDSLITLQQRKYERLQHLKQALLRKMFPKPGEQVPELRFEGFTEPWKERRLGDVGHATSGVGFPDAEQGGSSGVPFFKVSDMNLRGNENEMTTANNYVSDSQISRLGWKPVADVPAMFFAKVGAAVALNRKRLVRMPFLMDNNTMAYSLRHEYWNVEYAKALFETLDLPSLAQTGALPSYNSSDVEDMVVLMPFNFDEQQTIGTFFSRLDALIALYQGRHERLQHLKQALLRKMFV